MADSTELKIVNALLEGPSQALQNVPGTTLKAKDIVAAGQRLFVPQIFSEQVADAAASTDRVARVYYAQRNCRIENFGLDMDANVTGHASNYKTFDLKKYADGAAIGSALATQITTQNTPAGDLTARTKKYFTLTNGYVDLDAGEMLVLDIGHANAGVQLPKFTAFGRVRNR